MPTDIQRKLIVVTLTAIIGSNRVVAGPYEDALAASKRHDYATALRLLRPLAEKGDGQAQSDLGAMYYFNQGVARKQPAASAGAQHPRRSRGSAGDPPAPGRSRLTARCRLAQTNRRTTMPHT